MGKSFITQKFGNSAFGDLQLARLKVLGRSTNKPVSFV